MLYHTSVKLSEDRLIRRIRRLAEASEEIERGIGDDGCVIRFNQGRYVLSQDMLIEGIDFERSLLSFFDVGRKAVYVNISDILSMGAEPRYFLMSLGIPEDLSNRELMSFLKGVRHSSREFGLKLIGGDLSRSKKGFIVDICMVGELLTAHYLGRDGAQAADLIGVTGILGEASFGLWVLKRKEKGRGFKRFVERFRNPRPPYEVWKELVKNGIPNAMMDISDGLLLDLQRLLKESRKGAKVTFENIPIPPILLRKRMEALALTGGDDYQLLFTFPKEKLPLFEALSKKFTLHVIGEIMDTPGLRLYRQGRLMKLNKRGWDHFLEV